MKLKGLGPSQQRVQSLHWAVDITAHLPCARPHETSSQVGLSLLGLLPATPLQSPTWASRLLPE